LRNCLPGLPWKLNPLNLRLPSGYDSQVWASGTWLDLKILMTKWL
jgi:hypothetical protein